MQVVQVEYVKLETHVEVPESRESFMLKIVLLKPQKEVQEPTQRRNLFIAMHKAKGKCCKLITNNDSIYNLVSNMVDKLELKKITHPIPYR